MSEHPADIHELGKATIADAHLTEAYRSSALRLFTHRLDAKSQVPGFERLRDRARELKREVINNLDRYVEQFATQIEKRGGQVHWALTGEEACKIVIEIVRNAGAQEVVKAKTMVGEEIELNHALEAAGIRPVETDLGEFILQLAGERPAHIVAPGAARNVQEGRRGRQRSKLRRRGHGNRGRDRKRRQHPAFDHGAAHPHRIGGN